MYKVYFNDDNNDEQVVVAKDYEEAVKLAKLYDGFFITERGLYYDIATDFDDDCPLTPEEVWFDCDDLLEWLKWA